MCLKKVAVIALVLALAVWIRDNNTHYILKGLLAAWPLLLLLALGAYLIWQGLGLPEHRNHVRGHRKGHPERGK